MTDPGSKGAWSPLRKAIGDLGNAVAVIVLGLVVLGAIAAFFRNRDENEKAWSHWLTEHCAPKRFEEGALSNKRCFWCQLTPEAAVAPSTNESVSERERQRAHRESRRLGCLQARNRGMQVAMDAAGLPALLQAIRHLHGLEATWLESGPVVETHEGQTVWAGEVQVVAVEHPKASRVYAWSHETDSGKRRFHAVLGAGPVTGAEQAVRITMIHEFSGSP
jgi:hypothetical protein